ncbi:MAG: hypothetical protein QM767_20455 [Anaeromyxobacter sp.]
MLDVLAAILAVMMITRHGPVATRALAAPRRYRPFPVVPVITFLLSLAVLVAGLTATLRTIMSR